MSLKDMREWINNTSHPRSHSLAEKHVPAQVPGLDKRFSGNENVPQNSKKTSETEQFHSKPLGDVTNRMSVGVEKTRSYSNVGQKLTHDSKANNNSGVNKENFNSLRNTQLSKAIIDKNNTLILIEINKFRLMFKIYEKLKRMASDQKTLQSVLGGEILKRVEFVADLILRGNEESSKKKAEKLGLKELENYSREECNSGIKKYVAVIK